MCVCVCKCIENGLKGLTPNSGYALESGSMCVAWHGYEGKSNFKEGFSLSTPYTSVLFKYITYIKHLFSTESMKDATSNFS